VTRPAGARRLAGPQLVAAGLAVFLACGVLTALLGATLLDSRDYTLFAAFSGLLGVLVYGPGSSLEQESALRAGAGEGSRLRRAMRTRVLLGWLVVASAVLLPLGWQGRLLGSSQDVAAATLVLGAPVVLVLSVGRGLGVGRGAHGLVAASFVLAGVGTVLLPLLLLLAAVPRVTAFLVGPVLAWVPALLLLLLRRRRVGTEPQVVTHASYGGGDTVWIVTANLLVLANLLAVPPLLRWHVADLGTAFVADLQLLVSVSRLSTTAVLGFLPLLLSRLGARSALGTAPGTLWLAAGLGAATMLGAAALGNPFVEFLTGRDAGLAVDTIVLATLPAVLLCPALVLMGVAVARRRHVLLCAAWGSGAVVLAVTAAVDPRGSVGAVLSGVLVASALPLVVLAVGLRRRAAPRLGRVSVVI
jgi:hypothetical protein